MPIDGLVVSNIVFELNKMILNGRIDKIYQPEKDEIIISVRSESNSYKLLMTSNANYPRIHLTNLTKENPQTPPMFCMVLRKHLLGGKIVNIIQPEFERIIEIHIQSPNSIGNLTTKRLIIEIMGKHSNIILADENGKILDCIKHITENISSIREVLPNLPYTTPPNQKINPLETDFNKFNTLLNDSNNIENISKILVNSFTGFGNIISSQIANEYSLNRHVEESFDINELWKNFSSIVNIIKNNSFTPVLFTDSSIGKPIDFSSIDIYQYNDFDKEYNDKISNIIEKYYFEKDQKDRCRQKTEEIRKQLGILLDRSARKVERLNEKLAECQDKEKYKIWGDLIFANVHDIKPGQRELVTQNYYSQEQEMITVVLDEQLSPSENAQRYYKKYSKLKNAEQSSIEQLSKTEVEIDYLGSVLNSLDYCTAFDDINQIKLELESEGYLKKSSSRKKTNVLSKPVSFTSSDGFTILVGKNNIQNDQLTLKIAAKTDTWLHTKLIHGSHVIIKSEGRTIPEQTLLEAAIIAAYYSKAKNSGSIQIDYTLVKNVKKPSGAKPGMVIYVDYKTIVVTPDINIIEKLKNR